ncbi:Maleylacetoacetate isomerase / Glutathione S-transferase [hydrothermal vent metagenome]|uniref:Maleylacetoacetate isomerase / Glutathione S-transferase n=1 Tax=hydrothermal vent metagenome TaxID=652676 RepID=A0A3B0TT84_9ZZZZ
MKKIQLTCFAQTGNAYKVALMLNLCGAKWEPVFVDFFNRETQTPAYRQINEMGEVPVLTDGDKVLSQSGAILHYLADKYGRFGARTKDEGYEILRWILWDNHKLTSYIGTCRFLLLFAKTGQTEVTDFLAARSKSALKVLEAHLRDADFVVGDRPTIADISICGYLFWPDEIGVSWQDYPAIGAWLDRIKALEGWVHPYELMPGHPLPGGTD